MTTSLIYTASKTINNGKELLTATIKLGDECRNSHQDFSVTGTLYEAGKPRSDRYLISCGAMGDTIAKEMPELKLFCDLHLCDYNGVPMHAISNMFFHLSNKFNAGFPIDSEEHKAAYCECYRITSEEFDALRIAESETHFAVLWLQSDIRNRWISEAQTAIAKLEELTGQTFENNSTRSQLQLPSGEAMQTELERIASGYYTEEARQARLAAKRAAKRAKMIEEAESDKRKYIEKTGIELAVKLAIFDTGIELALDQTIYYSHDKTVKFNWRGYGETLSPAEIATIKATVKLPEGVTFRD